MVTSDCSSVSKIATNIETQKYFVTRTCTSVPGTQIHVSTHTHTNVSGFRRCALKIDFSGRTQGEHIF